MKGVFLHLSATCFAMLSLDCGLAGHGPALGQGGPAAGVQSDPQLLPQPLVMLGNLQGRTPFREERLHESLVATCEASSYQWSDLESDECSPPPHGIEGSAVPAVKTGVEGWLVGMTTSGIAVLNRSRTSLSLYPADLDSGSHRLALSIPILVRNVSTAAACEGLVVLGSDGGALELHTVSHGWAPEPLMRPEPLWNVGRVAQVWVSDEGVLTAYDGRSESHSRSQKLIYRRLGGAQLNLLAEGALGTCGEMLAGNRVLILAYDPLPSVRIVDLAPKPKLLERVDVPLDTADCASIAEDSPVIAVTGKRSGRAALAVRIADAWHVRELSSAGRTTNVALRDGWVAVGDPAAPPSLSARPEEASGRLMLFRTSSKGLAGFAQVTSSVRSTDRLFARRLAWGEKRIYVGSAGTSFESDALRYFPDVEEFHLPM